ELFDKWQVKDPISNFEAYLFAENILNETLKSNIYNELKHGMDDDLAAVFAEAEIVADTEEEINDVYAPYTYIAKTANTTTSKKRLVDAISDGLKQSMERFPNTVIMGQDIAEYGGVFKITDNFYKLFGTERVRNTPITESSILGAGYGLAIKGFKAIVEMQ